MFISWATPAASWPIPAIFSCCISWIFDSLMIIFWASISLTYVIRSSSNCFCLITLLSRAINSISSIGLWIKSTAPISKHCSSDLPSEMVEYIITLIFCLNVDTMRLNVSTPSIPGIIISNNTISILLSLIDSKASSPFSAK